MRDFMPKTSSRYQSVGWRMLALHRREEIAKAMRRDPVDTCIYEELYGLRGWAKIFEGLSDYRGKTAVWDRRTHLVY